MNYWDNYYEFELFKREIRDISITKNNYDDELIINYTKYLQETYEYSCLDGWNEEFKKFINFIKPYNRNYFLHRTHAGGFHGDGYYYHAHIFYHKPQNIPQNGDDIRAHQIIYHNLLPSNGNECNNIIEIIKKNREHCDRTLDEYMCFINRFLDFEDSEEYQDENTIKFGSFFNEELKNIPSTVKEIEFGQFFNKELKNLPPNLEQLTLGKNFNCSFDIPKTVKHLKIKGFINKPLILHEGIETLIFEDNFNDVINYPSSLKTLIIGHNFNQNIDNLPSGLEKLIIGNKYFNEYDYSFFILFSWHYYKKPINNFNKPINNLPINLKHLEIYHDFNQPIDKLPNGLTYLSLGNNFNQPIDNLPNGLTYLCLGNNFKQQLDFLPVTLKKLKISSNVNYQLNNLPSNTEVIKV